MVTLVENGELTKAAQFAVSFITRQLISGEGMPNSLELGFYAALVIEGGIPPVTFFETYPVIGAALVAQVGRYLTDSITLLQAECIVMRRENALVLGR